MCDKHSLRDLIWEDWKKQGREMDYLLEKDCEKCVHTTGKTQTLWNCPDTATPPKTAYAIMMEKKKRDVTMWFTEEKYNMCGHDIYTDGKLYWCSEECYQTGKRGKDTSDYMGFISDLVK